MIHKIETLITGLLEDYFKKGFQTEICLNKKYFDNNYNHKEVDEITISSLNKLYYGRLCGRQRLASFLFVLAEVHELFLSRSHCTYRQLYYKNIILKSNTLQIHCAVNDVCQVLNTASWNLGIFAAGKCLISGTINVHMCNGDVIDCNPCKGPTLIPSNFTYIDKFITTAQFVLIVEKYTVFQNLIANDIFSLLNGNIILVTARGYPDICTRWILHKMWVENHLPMYILVDGDPFGIDIMLIYRYGSDAQIQHANNLSCPQLKWLGIHPSDISSVMMMEIEPLSLNDNNKIENLLRRSYVDADICTELLTLQMLQYKVKIDNLSKGIFSLFTINYIVNKIKRQIVL